MNRLIGAGLLTALITTLVLHDFAQQLATALAARLP